MDNAVALVQAYLNVNGYFTVAEYPVIEAMRNSGYRTTTDLDILAFRFPGAGRVVPGGELDRVEPAFETDPELRCSASHPEMVVCEVKEGRAEFNERLWDPLVLSVMLARFGCCRSQEATEVVRCLLRKGRALTPCGHQVRLLGFGSVVRSGGHPRYDVISLSHVLEFLREHLRRHWDVLRHAQFKDPAFSFLSTLEKARREVPA